ncbi:MAG: ATP-binding cassette domain-containing protein, partial [Rhodobacteraceae bacterium]|nr:ATP-binding cassette domain-containing protein [Paracoccaceae bacterium]
MSIRPALPRYAVEISGLNKVYAGSNKRAPKHALKDFSLAIPRGSFFGLLGPNGGGKTTLFRILSTLLEPAEGRALIFGSDVAKSPIEARRRIGVVFQNQSLDRRLSVEENLDCQGRLYGLGGADLKER